MELRYLGFDQLQNARAFRFDVVVKGAVTMQAVVVADMALFLKYRVGIQDGPSLCAARLTTDLEQNVEGDHVLTADDLRGLCERRAAEESKRVEMRRMASRRASTGPEPGNPRGL
jgi:hypothetical protein